MKIHNLPQVAAVSKDQFDVLWAGTRTACPFLRGQRGGEEVRFEYEGRVLNPVEMRKVWPQGSWEEGKPLVAFLYKSEKIATAMQMETWIDAYRNERIPLFWLMRVELAHLQGTTTRAYEEVRRIFDVFGVEMNLHPTAPDFGVPREVWRAVDLHYRSHLLHCHSKDGFSISGVVFLDSNEDVDKLSSLFPNLQFIYST